MLTQSEKLWLKIRMGYLHYSCRYCEGRRSGTKLMQNGRPCVRYCYTHHLEPPCYKMDKPDDAAIFEARVAARLSISLEALGFYGLEAELLKRARLSVEEEMDG